MFNIYKLELEGDLKASTKLDESSANVYCSTALIHAEAHVKKNLGCLHSGWSSKGGTFGQAHFQYGERVVVLDQQI